VYVSTLFIRILLTELERRAWSGTPLLDEGLINPVVLRDPRATITTEAWARLLLRALELTRDPALGIGMGASVSPSRLQTVGSLIGSCGTLRESIAVSQRYQLLLSANTVWELEEQGDVARLYCNDAIEDSVARRTSLEATLVLTYRIGKELVAVGSDEVWFQHEAPSYASQYSRAFTCPVYFGRPRNALVFSRSLLDQRLPHGDQAVHTLLRRHAETLLDERAAQSLSARVRALLRCEDKLANITAVFVAKRLSMTVRTLRRALFSERTRLTDLLNEAQVRIAKKALSAQGVVIKEVAHELGFSDASAFHRAFKRWTGLTPTQFMRNGELRPQRRRGEQELLH
jgi:AraC-like DNA-binding protein